MKTFLVTATCAFLLPFNVSSLAATRYVNLNNPNPSAPYSDWNTAATNIQDAIEAAADGDLVLVTNGVYSTGGKVKFGDLTNRVVLDKAITVQSVNGPWVTTIRGAGATNGTSAVRCAWITNGATLQGFTLTAGATRASGDSTNLLSGGGALCLNTNVLIKNCVVVSNVAQNYGGGVFQGVVANSAIIGNRVQVAGSGAAYAILVNSTVVSNWTSAATFQSRHTNSIVYYNSSGNSSGGTFAFSCTTPSAAGMSNIITAPQLFSDSIHLMSASPCRAAGTNLVVGTDIDGQSWADPPSIGCDQWREPPILITQPRIQMTNDPIGFTVSVTAAGQEPFICDWTRNGFPVENDGRFSFAHTTNLVASGVGEWSAGSYQVVISNAFGVVTSAVAQLVFHYVNGGNSSPQPPYASWSNAATNIQDAIDAAAAGEVVLVTNGIYRSGGKVMVGDLTNRVALDKAVIVQSVNGSEATIIEGNWNPTVTNGPAAVRCAWLTNGAALSGFTLRGGATRQVSNPLNQQMNGGGVWGSSTNAVVMNCAVLTNLAASQGGGAYQVALVNCTLNGNRAVGSGTPGTGIGNAGQGGGAANSNLKNCLIRGNSADQWYGGGVAICDLVNCALVGNSSYMNGGAAYAGKLVNCTVTRNTSSGYSGGYGAAVHSATLTNCLVWGNFSRTSYPNTNYASSTLTYCLSSPLPAGAGNVSVDPLILDDGVHLTEFSPCRAAGANVAIAADIDGQAWANPPSIGCDEWQAVPVIGTTPTFQIGIALRSLKFNVIAAGQTPFFYFWLKDGTLIQDNSHYSDSSTANLKVDKFGPEDAGAYRVIVTNAFGAATSQVAQVVIHCVDAAGTSPVAPYSNWPTAANRIQDAIDAAAAGDIVLVTNGIYSTGGKAMSEDLTNRVAIDKPITVMSVNGFGVTVIEGAYDPISTNGPSAIRGVWLMEGAVLGGFTVRNGATRGGNFLTFDQQGGGGIWAISPAATVMNCLLTNNAARWVGAGIYNGTLKNSVLIGNIVDALGSSSGGAAAYADLRNCTIKFNYSKSGSGAAGTYNGTVRNCIVFDNYMTFGFQPANYTGSGGLISYSYSCTSPLPSGAGNISATPVYVDTSFHLLATSPCRNAGSSLYASGEDMDGEAWANPPSIGADEVIEANLVGPISFSVNGWQTNTLVGSDHRLIFWDSITGMVSRIDWNFGDGVVITNIGNSSGLHWWTNSGNYTVTSTAYNNDHPGGVSASLDVQVLPVLSPSLQPVSIDSNGFKFAFDAQEMARYDVQFATNLTPPVVWKTLQTINYSLGGTTLIADPAWTNAVRFYRVQAR